MMPTKRYPKRPCPICGGQYTPKQPRQAVCGVEENPSCKSAWDRQRKQRDAERAKAGKPSA